MSLETMLPLIGKTRSPLSPSEFHNAVNVVFHDVEAVHYDKVHADMWGSLGEQMELLVMDAQDSLTDKNLRLLDIGCGTGLSTQLLLQTSIGQKITHITLADTSPNMLEHAKKRSAGWNREIQTHHGDISSIAGKFDVVLICSVLHHIPDIEGFLDIVAKLQEPGGVLLHLQDPNGDYLNDGELQRRQSEYEATRHESLRTRVLGVVPKEIKSRARRMLGIKNYIDEVNDRLLSMNVIRNRMTAEEIWSVTDIHVEGLPYSAGGGISINQLKSHLKNYKLISTRSYGFFGDLKSSLPHEFQVKEQELINSKSPNGRNIAGIWVKS